MKRKIALVLALVLMLSLAGCGKDKSGADTTTTPNTTTTAPQGPQQTTTGAPNPTDTTPAATDGFAFQAGDASLMPGAVYDPSALPEPESVYTIPSCAFEGTDNVYSFGAYEVTTYSGTGTEVIYSIYLLDANTATSEGLALGDDLAKVQQLYGTDGAADSRELVYTRGQTQLVLILQDDVVISIEYRMV